MTDAAHGAGQDPLAAHDSSVSLGQAALTGLRQPIVAILLLIAFFTTISGKPLDGFLMLTVATLLVWDAARSRLSESGRSVGRLAGPPAHERGPGGSAIPALAESGATGYTAASVCAAGGYLPEARLTAGIGPVARNDDETRSRGRAILAGLGWLTAGLLYAGVVGAFSRFSWPATFFVVALGCLMVAVGWQGPLRQRQALSGQPLRRAWLWAAVLIAGGLWELSSLLQQPHLTTDSYTHPTISALTDPLLVSHPGRTVALGIWLAIGWFLAGR